MAEGVNCIHHVVWCIEPESMPRVRALWEDALGVAMQDIDLPDLGIHVMISWEAGIEIMAPTYAEGALVQTARDFLAEKGEGVFSVVFNVANLADSVARYSSFGATLAFEEDIPADEIENRDLGSEGEGGFAVKQALFDDLHGIRLCLQQLAND